MKRIFYCIFTLFIIVSLAGCTQEQLSETNMTPDEIVSVIIESQTDCPAFTQITSSDSEFITYLSDYYFINTEQVKEGAIDYADGVEASEITVLVLTDEKAGEAIYSAWEEYMKKRAEVFEGYAPLQSALIKNGKIVVNGRYAALLICSDTSAAEAAFFQCFEENESNFSNISTISLSASLTKEKSKSNVASKIYDADAVLQAYKTGDTSSLSDMNLSILNAAKDVINKKIKKNMSDYEKELAIHDWITDWSSFDYGVFSRSSNEDFEAGSDTPYGVLINRSAMCHGYSSTFQLFMDMLNIECITVFGTPGSNGVEHSWNMVKLDGEWYCVDTAWDDPIGGSPGHSYFNVTSEYLRRGSIHHWDENSVPEATSTTYAYGK